MNISLSLAHLLIPRHTNNYKAKVLTTSSLLSLATLFVLVHTILGILSAPRVAVLGYASSISPDKVIELTNVQRLEAGVGKVIYSQELENAARLKAEDMLAKGYWAHTAPDGTEPWDFFKSVGYVYRFAGENLARDFSNSESAVEAWLASPSHRENMLSGKYTEIGVAVIEGDLNGKDTTLIVQLFGTPRTAAPAIPEVAAEVGLPSVNAAPPVLAQKSEPAPIVAANSFDLMRAFTVGVVAILLVVFATDVVVISRRGITRMGGKTLAHLSFMVMILVILFIVRAGEII